jgi:predicted secreted hydrolase
VITRLLTLAAAVVAGAAAAATAAFHFPRDHYAHDAGIEWWYTTAYARGSDGHRYSIFFTLFKSRHLLLPVSQVVDLDTGEVVGHSDAVYPGQVGTTGVDVRLPDARLRYDPATNTWLFGASSLLYSLTMTATPQKPYVLHGGGSGIVREGRAVSSYYSATRMSAHGTISHGLVSIPFTADAWFDHQWGPITFDRRVVHWDWFSCRFDDRTELMLYRFRHGGGGGTLVDRAGHGMLVTGFTLAAGNRVFDGRWPLDWTLRVAGLSLTIHAIVPDQVVRGALVPPLWEGASTVTGTKRGICFVEET